MKTTRALLGACVALLGTMASSTAAQQTGGLPALAEDLAAEIAARMAADMGLTGSLEAEVAARLAADQALADALAGETAARIAGDGTLAGKGCGPGLILSGFDAQGAPICSCPALDIRPHVQVPGDYWWVRAAEFSDRRNYVQVAPGASVPLYIEYSHWTIPDCPGCLIEFLVGFTNQPPDPANCVTPFIAPKTGSQVIPLVAPTEPGVYTISVSRTLEYSCIGTWANWNSFPVAAVCVQ